MESDLTLNLQPADAEELAQIRRAFLRWAGGQDCPYCRHPVDDHLGGANVPLYFRPAFEHETEVRQIYEPMLDSEVEGAPTPFLVRERLGNAKVVSEVYCRRCARRLRTSQVMCYRRIIGLGETVRLDGRVIYPDPVEKA